MKNSSLLSGRVLLKEDLFEHFAQGHRADVWCSLTSKPLVCGLLSAWHHIRIDEDNAWHKAQAEAGSLDSMFSGSWDVLLLGKFISYLGHFTS